jgi:hypothetical protein
MLDLHLQFSDESRQKMLKDVHFIEALCLRTAVEGLGCTSQCRHRRIGTRRNESYMGLPGMKWSGETDGLKEADVSKGIFLALEPGQEKDFYSLESTTVPRL